MGFASTSRMTALSALTPLLACGISLIITPNGSFEEDTNRDGAPDGWRAVTFDSPGTAAWDRNVAHSGSASVRLANSAHPENTAWNANTVRWILTRNADIEPGQAVTAEGWLRTDLTQGEAKIVLAWFADGKWLQEDGSAGVRGKTDWTQQTVTVQAPAEATQVSIYLMLNFARGQAWFDDVKAFRGTEAPGNFRTVDLSTVANVGFRDDEAGDGKGGWTDQGTNDLRRFEPGRHTLRGIPFTILDPDVHDGRSCLVLKGRGREDVTASAQFDVHETFDVLYLLQGAAWAGRDDSRVADYVLHYSDGVQESVAVRTGREVTDWWNPADAENCAVGWRGANAESDNIGLVIFPLRNPRPDILVESVSVRTQPDGNGPNLMLVAATAGDGDPVFPELPIHYRFANTENWYPWDFPVGNPDLGELDLSRFLDAPAGKHGFASVDEAGHIVFENGTRGRFFGTNIGGSRCCPPREQAEIWSARLASYGVNMLRLHAFDSRWGSFIDYSQGTSQMIDPDAFDRLDYFVAALKRRGIYVYFDLLDYRSFLPGDNVRDAENMQTRWEHSIKGASIFNRRLIDLQKDYATALLTHRNPYTGLRYVDEPALVIQEITNENSLFYLSNRNLMLPSYFNELRQLWNQWLLKTYDSRAALRQAWTDPQGHCALTADEDPAQGTVHLPTQFLYSEPTSVEESPMQAAVRLNAMTRFLYEVQVNYFREMSAHLRDLGLKCLITGTNQDFSDASNRANAFCQAMTRNNYWCHPNIRAEPWPQFRNLSMLSSNLANTATLMANIASSTVAGKPMIVPEFNMPWPNEFRAEVLPLMAVYGCLQQWDGLLFFAYETRPDRGRLTYFGNTMDPVRWGQFPLAAILFHRQDVEPARHTVHIGISEVDAFSTRSRRGSDTYNAYAVLSTMSKVRSAHFDDMYRGDADVVLASGHSAHGNYSQAKRAIVFADASHADEAGFTENQAAQVRSVLPGLETQAHHDGITTIVPTSLPPGATPVMHDGRTVGVLTDRFCVVPSASQLTGEKDGVWLHRHLLGAYRHWGLSGAGPDAEAGRIFRSDTGELIWNAGERRFTAITPRFRSVIGFFGEGDVVLGDVKVSCRNPFAAVNLVSLDNSDSLAAAQKALLTVVSRAKNSGQATVVNQPADQNGGSNEFLPQSTIDLGEHGRAPVLVEPVDAEITLPWPQCRAFALDETGHKSRQIAVTAANGRATLSTASARSPWILLDRQ